MTAHDIFESFWISPGCYCLCLYWSCRDSRERVHFSQFFGLRSWKRRTVGEGERIQVEKAGELGGGIKTERGKIHIRPPRCATYVLFVQLSFVFPFQVRRRLRRTNVLILDEISMLSGDFLDRASELLSHVRKQEDPFGGLQVVLCGDFLQLPPVKAETLAFQASIWSKSLVSKIELFR